MTERGNNNETNRPLRVVVGLVVVSALVPLIWSILMIGRNFTSAETPLIAAFAIIGLAHLIRVPIRVHSTTTSFAPTSATIMVSLALAPPRWVIVSVFTGILLVYLANRTEPIKLAFNTAKDTVAATAAALTASAAHLSPTPVGEPLSTPLLSMLPVLALAGAAYAVVDEALHAIVVSLASRTPIRQRLLTHADTRLLLRIGSLAIAAGTLWMYSIRPWLLIALPPLVYALYLTTANRVRGRTEREAWQRLAQATDELNVVELDAVARTAVQRAAELFSAEEVDLIINDLTPPGAEPADDPAGPRLVRGNAQQIGYDGPQADAPATDDRHVIETVLDGFQGTADTGHLKLRFRGPVRLSERERYALHTFAAALCTAIRNAGAFTETRRLAESHAKAAGQDPLTLLANRRRLQEYGTSVLGSVSQRGVTAVLLIDLNHFKEINDTLGHTAGDRVLIEVAHRLVAAVGADDLVARLGGDEFAVLLVGLSAPAVASVRANAVLTALCAPIELDGIRISIEASSGVATAPAEGGVAELLRRADIAMYQAKRAGHRVSTYARARDTADISSLALGGDLARAVSEHQFTVDFQPIVDLGSGEVVAAEALARWHHPNRGYLPPSQFLDAIERSGQLPAFAEAVLAQAISAATRWAAEGFPLAVAVNVSPRSLLDPSFPDTVAAQLASHDLPAESLVIELTESVTLSQLDIVDEVLAALRSIGVRLALDDFGTGYSSLSTVARVPVYELKIDRSFVAAMDTRAAGAVVRSTIELGRSLGLLVVAEGIEREEQRRKLWELGAPSGQGHLFSRPVAAHRLLAMLQRGHDGRPGTIAASIHEAGSVIRMPPPKRGAQGNQRKETS